MQQLSENDMDDYKMSSNPKPTKEHEQGNSFRRKLLTEYITFQSEDHDFVRLYTDLEKKST